MNVTSRTEVSFGTLRTVRLWFCADDFTAYAVYFFLWDETPSSDSDCPQQTPPRPNSEAKRTYAQPLSSFAEIKKCFHVVFS